MIREIQATKEPVGWCEGDSKRPDGVTHSDPLGQREVLAWDVTVPNTFEDSHLEDTSVKAGAAVDHAAAMAEKLFLE